MVERRRHDILKAAKKLFFHYGPLKTTMNDIAREAQCAVGSVYLDFPSKEAILEELSTAEYDGVLARMSARARADVKELFASTFAGVLDERTRAFFAVARAGTHTPDIFHCHASCVRSARGRFDDQEAALYAEIFRDAGRKGECADGDFLAMARVVQRCVASLSPPWVFDLGEAKAAAATREIGGLMLNGLCARQDAKTKRKR